MTISQESALTGEKTATRPFTGAEYLESLRDGREVYIYGERVKDITTHPAFRNSARMLRRRSLPSSVPSPWMRLV